MEANEGNIQDEYGVSRSSAELRKMDARGQAMRDGAREKSAGRRRAAAPHTPPVSATSRPGQLVGVGVTDPNSLPAGGLAITAGMKRDSQID